MSHKVKVNAVLKKNGQFAYFGDEVDDNTMDNIEQQVKDGYLQKSKEFDADRKKDSDDIEAAKKAETDKVAAEKDKK